MKMKELEDRTGVHRETIRVYLRHELIPPPERPRKTVAVYSEEHVRAILAVRRLQSESRLTLPQIKAFMRGETTPRVSANVFPHLEQLVASRVGLDEHLVSLGSLSERYPAARADAQALASFGAVEILHEGSDEAVRLPDAELIAIWGEMRAEGFLEDLDFSPRMLDFYVEAARFVGGWEARTFLERTEGRIGEDDAAAMIERALPLMLNFFGLLRRKEFMRGIRSREPLRREAPRLPATPDAATAHDGPKQRARRSRPQRRAPG